MATVYFAIDAADGLSLPDGLIVGMSDSLTVLRSNGFAAGTYTGNRLAQIDHEAAGFNADCQPRLLGSDGTTVLRNGWYWIGGETKARIESELLDLQEAIRTYQRQVVAWNAELIARGVGQPPGKVTQGHNRLYSSLGYIYLISRDSSNSLADRKILVANMTTGAQDIRKVDDFYTADTGTSFDAPPRGESTSRWTGWVAIANPGTKLLLANSVEIVGNVPVAVNLLGDDWVAAIAS